jgi:hypothetical protein
MLTKERKRLKRRRYWPDCQHRRIIGRRHGTSDPTSHPLQMHRFSLKAEKEGIKRYIKNLKTDIKDAEERIKEIVRLQKK